MFFKKIVKPLAAACVALGLSTSVWAETSYNNIYVFGDSLSDTGNLFAETTLPPSPYFNGRMSNGKMWIEYLHEAFGLTYEQANNYAWAGARTDDSNMLDSVLQFIGGDALGLSEQIDSYLATNTINAESLYIVWAGPNDYLKNITDASPSALSQPGEYVIDDLEQQVATSVNNIVAALDTLSQAGASQILVINMADTGGTPNVAKIGLTTEVTAVSVAFNDALQAAVNQLDYDVLFFDVYTLHVTATANPESYGLTNTTDSCLSTKLIFSFNTCDNPDEYLSWDGTHPTTVVHQIIASHLYTFLQEDSAPVDTTTDTPTDTDTPIDTVTDTDSCDGSACRYDINLDNAGFYVATADIANDGTEGFFGMVAGFTGSDYIFDGFHAGAMLDNSVSGFATFELAANETAIDISVYEYNGVVDGLNVVVTDNNGTEVSNATMSTSSTATIDNLTAGGQYTVTVSQPSTSNGRGYLGLSVIAKMVNSINTGGLIDGTGSAFLGFYADTPSTELNIYYGDSYTNTGATQPNVKLYGFTGAGNALVFSNEN